MKSEIRISKSETNSNGRNEKVQNEDRHRGTRDTKEKSGQW